MPLWRGVVVGSLLITSSMSAPFFARADTAPTSQPAQTRPSAYTTKRPSPDGIGKVYYGREIARVMGHLAADWLDRPEREKEERPRKAVDLMKLRPTDVVADIGAGSGYFSLMMARDLKDGGKVLAVDIQPEMLEIVRKKCADAGIKNVEPVLGAEADPRLPEAGVDVVLFVDAYHEFEFPQEMMQAIFKALKPGGRLVQIEYRAEDPRVFIKPLHKMSEAQARVEMESVGFRFVENVKGLPQQHMLIFEKPVAPANPASTPVSGPSTRPAAQ